MKKSTKRLVDYYQEILNTISFADRATFRKELRKAYRRLLPEEREQLKDWFRTACVCKVAPEPVKVRAGK
jgi:hypothetical protein